MGWSPSKCIQAFSKLRISISYQLVSLLWFERLRSFRFRAVSQGGSSKISLGPAIPYHSTPCVWPTLGQPNGRQWIGHPQADYGGMATPPSIWKRPSSKLCERDFLRFTNPWNIDYIIYIIYYIYYIYFSTICTKLKILIHFFFFIRAKFIRT
jgi:hypothetical protein